MIRFNNYETSGVNPGIKIRLVVAYDCLQVNLQELYIVTQKIVLFFLISDKGYLFFNWSHVAYCSNLFKFSYGKLVT